MNQDILLSKIVPNPTDSTWAQAYTTLNVYITLSIHNENSKHPVTTYGKELLEKLQREFFALDEKTLENIKNAVGNVSKTIPQEYSYSILVGSIVENVLYIVIASLGQVIIKRNGKLGVIATGTENELHGFSGKLEHDDILLFETGDFAERLPVATISEHIASEDVSQIAESITPLIHDGSKGTEGAIIIQYKNLKHDAHSNETPVAKPEEAEDFEVEEEKAEKIENEETAEEKESPPMQSVEEENLWTKSRENRAIEDLADDNNESTYEEKKTQKPFIALPNLKFGNKKLIIVGVVVVLIVVLAGSIFLQFNKQSETKKLAEFSTVYQPVKDKFDESVNLMSLNKTLALAEFSETSKLVDDALQKFPSDSTEYKKLAELKSQIESKVSELGGGGSAKNVKEFVKVGGSITSITGISTRGGKIVMLDSKAKKVITLSAAGKVLKSYDIEESANEITSDDKFIYTLGDSVTQIDTGNGDTKVIVKEANGTSLQSFGSNVYTVTSDDILKYKAPSYAESSYFTDKAQFKSKPVAIGISGPVWVFEDDGGIERFTKGQNDNIELKGLAGPLGRSSQIYTDTDLENMYVLDVKNQRVVAFNSDGEYQTQYEGSFMKSAQSFAIDETNKTGYVVSDDIIYSFDL